MINWDRVDELRHEVGPEDFNEVIELFFGRGGRYNFHLGHV